MRAGRGLWRNGEPHHLCGGCSQGFSSSNGGLVRVSGEAGECRARGTEVVSILPLKQQTAREGQIFKVDPMQFLLYCTLVLKINLQMYLCQTISPVINIIHDYAELSYLYLIVLL